MKHILATLLLCGSLALTPAALAQSRPLSPSTAAAPVGCHLEAARDDKFRLALPDSWAVADPQSAGYRDGLSELEHNNPGLTQGEKDAPFFLAREKDSLQGFAENVNVRVDPLQPADVLKLDAATADALKAELKKTLPLQGDLEVRAIHLPAGDAVCYQGDLRVKLNEGKVVDYDMVGYIMQIGSEQFTVTFSFRTGDKIGSAARAEGLMQTFSIGN